jgi:hypothetical protein
MSDAYNFLKQSGCVGRFKRDVLLEATYDLEYVGVIHNAFSEAGEDARNNATNCTAVLITELIAKGLCFLATWGAGYGSEPLVVQKTRSELEAIIIASLHSEHCWDYFLIATPVGRAWVDKYKKLIDEL